MLCPEYERVVADIALLSLCLIIFFFHFTRQLLRISEKKTTRIRTKNSVYWVDKNITILAYSNVGACAKRLLWSAAQSAIALVRAIPPIITSSIIPTKNTVTARYICRQNEYQSIEILVARHSNTSISRQCEQWLKTVLLLDNGRHIILSQSLVSLHFVEIAQRKIKVSQVIRC